MLRWMIGCLFCVCLAQPVFAQDAKVAANVLVSPSSHNTYNVQATNYFYGPVEMEITMSPPSENIQSNPALPIRILLSPLETRTIASLTPINHSYGGRFSINAKVIPGSPNARHQDNYAYAWPIASGVGRIEQGFGGKQSHTDPENYYAIDIAAPPGTHVIASRPGVVMAVEDRFTQSGLDPSLLTRSNYVRVLQEDGTMAVYVHLQHGGIRVVVGQSIATGQLIGLVGDVGFASGPHLHFAVQINHNFSLQTVPFRMYQPPGAGDDLIKPHTMIGTASR